MSIELMVAGLSARELMSPPGTAKGAGVDKTTEEISDEAEDADIDDEMVELVVSAVVEVVASAVGEAVVRITELSVVAAGSGGNPTWAVLCKLGSATSVADEELDVPSIEPGTLSALVAAMRLAGRDTVDAGIVRTDGKMEDSI